MRYAHYLANVISLALTLALITAPISAFYQEPQPEHRYEHSRWQSFLYAARTLRWFVDTQGGRVHTHAKLGGVRHRLPPLIEQYYRHLAIVTETPDSLSLNFPGTITMADKTSLGNGIFCITLADDTIFHRYFHYAERMPQLKKELRCHTNTVKRLGREMERNFMYINFDSLGKDDERGPIDTCIAELYPELHAAEPYEVWENPYFVDITDRTGKTYTLFKSHTIAKRATK